MPKRPPAADDLDYDVLIIGAGQCGIPLARRLANEGWRTAVAERRHLGGSCVNFGCTPTKAVVASARVAHLARRGAEFGLKTGGVTVDLPAVLGRARKMVEASVAGIRKGLDRAGVTVLKGHARFAGRRGEGFALTVSDRPVTARQVVLDTGTRSAIPAIDGLSDVPFIHAGSWLHHDTQPASLLILGAGVIALEMAQFYRRCGAEVCVIGNQKRVAGHEDPDVADGLQRVLEDEGVRFRLGVDVRSVRKAGDGVSVTLDDGVLSGTHLFVATGRTPNTDDLGLDTVGVRLDDRGIVAVDDRLATNVAGVWAAGDIRGGPMFTHSSWDDHRVLESQLLEDGRHTKAGRIVPYAIFTDPELGRVGLSETEARKQHGDAAIKVATFQMSDNGKANQQGEPAGFIKVIVEKETSKLLGAAVLADEGAELVAAYVTLMNAGVSLAAVCRGIYIHPTLSEALQSAVMALDLDLR